MTKRSLSLIHLITLSILLTVTLFASNPVFAGDASEIEEVMCKYQSKFHYVAVANPYYYTSKYLTWPSLNCSSAPSYPSGFYKDITEETAEELVNDIAGKFYEMTTAKTNISGYFLESLPDGKENTEPVIVTEPNSLHTWQDRLAQVSGDIDKLNIYNVGAASIVDYIVKGGTGHDYTEFAESDCGGEITENGSFQDANSLAQGEWDNSIVSGSDCTTIGIVTASSHWRSVYQDCNDVNYNYDSYSASVSSVNVKLSKDLSLHNGTAHSYLKLVDRNGRVTGGCMSLYGFDGVGPFAPVAVDTDPNSDPNFCEWEEPTTGEVWDSNNLFPDEAPGIPAPSRYQSGPNEDGSFWKSSITAWGFKGSLIIVEPNFIDATDPVESCGEPNELVYKDIDKHIVYSAGTGCGHNVGETVSGRIMVNGYESGMLVEVQLGNTFSPTVASLKINTTTINPSDPNSIYCFSPQQDDPNEPYYVPYSITAYTGEDQVSFSTAAVYTEQLGDEASDPNEAQRVTAYYGEGDTFSFSIETNGYECCNRASTLNTGLDMPGLSMHENGDIEIYFADVNEAYIWGSASFYGDPPTGSYSQSCGFLDMSIYAYTPDGGSPGEYIKLSGSGGRNFIYSIDSGWLTDDTASSATFVDEVDADDNPIKTASYDANGKLDRISDASDPTNFYRQFNYDDPANPDRMTSYTDYAGGLSRTYTYVYDEVTGRLAGTIGGTGSGCSSCALSGGSHLYTFDDNGNILTETDTEGNVIYEFEYDEKNRQIAKWLGSKIDLKPIQEIVYDTDTAGFGGVELKDVYNYTTDDDFNFTRNVIDSNGQVITKITFDGLNVDSEAISSDPNLIIAAGGNITTYEYEYSGTTLQAIAAKSPAFNEGEITSYYKNTLNNSVNTSEENILISVDPNGIKTETTLSKSYYGTYTINGVSARRMSYSYDYRGWLEDKYTSYNYNTSNGQVSSLNEPGVYQLNGDNTAVVRSYTYHADGRVNTETVSNNSESATRVISTYYYDAMGNSAGVQAKDYYGNVLYDTWAKSNGFGEDIYSINKTGVARGKEYDGYGKLISEFVFADVNDTALFDGDDPNALIEDISAVYASLNVVSQKQYVYDTLGRVSEVKVAVADDVFVYDTPDGWYSTTYTHDDYGRKTQQVEDSTGLQLTTDYEYDNQGQVFKTTYPDGRWVKQIRNGRGLTTKTVNGHGLETQDPNDFVISETVYDADGNALKKIKAGEVVSSYELDDKGMVYRQYQGDYTAGYCDYTEFVRDVDGSVTGQLTVSVDSVGNETVISESSTIHNVRGERIEQRVIADSDTGEDDLDDKVSLFSYDYQGKLVETVTKADGNSTVYTNANKDRVEYEADDMVEQSWYGIEGKLEYTFKFEYAGDALSIYDLPFSSINSAFGYTKDSQEVFVTSQSYSDSRIREKKVLIGFDGNDLLWRSIQRYEFDDAGRIEKTIDADDNYRTFGYNSRGQQTEQTLFQGKPILRMSDGSYDPNTFDAYPLSKVLTDYDDAGRRVRQAQLYDPNSSVSVDNVDLSLDRVTDIVYDSYGRLYREKNYFDGSNQRISLKEYLYDEHGRVETVELGEIEQIDVFGDIWETKFPQKTITYYYNLKGEKDQQRVTNVNTVTWATVNVDTYFDYDSQGRLDEIQNAQGITYSCKHDALGRKVEETDAVGKVTKYYYNQLGVLTDKVEDPTGLNRTTSYEYDRFGRRDTIKSGTDQTDYTYNYLGAITKVEYPGTDETDYVYDMLGSAIKRTVTKDSQSTTTHYKRNTLGQISFKQYTDATEWTEPNNALPFDEILYDAMGKKRIIAGIEDGNDLELNIYSYDGLGNMTGATETGDFSSSVSYGYDQRGQIISITYPNDTTVNYTRDAMGRVETVSYDDMVIAEYGWLGDKVVKKTMTDADIELDVTIDALDRVTGETFSNISDSTSLITNSYDYTSYSSRLDERNTVDYGFDTLGKLTTEDAVSYTSDILGNPTNATDDDFTYTTDDEDRVTKVEDDTVTLGEYDYDRLGRRSKKTVNSVDTYYVYDIMGNVIAEYEKTGTGDAEWTRDYVYGATGEAVYMKFPQTTTTNTELDNFIAFAEAWLCEPNCTTADLDWDIDDSNNIDLVDFALSALDFDDGFTINGRYLMADFRNSVIGKVNLDGSVDEIGYDAWGTPSVDAGADLEGLSILWNGYYYDTETDNYYLRNRYYSPLERKFVTEDPYGTNPDGTWNSSFGIDSQYNDGYGLTVYVQGDPINNIDPWGLKIVEYKNSGLQGHAGLLVDGIDYDFGPATSNPFWGPGICQWIDGGPGKKKSGGTIPYTTWSLRKTRTGYLWGGFATFPGKKIKPCKCAKKSEIIDCVLEMCGYYSNHVNFVHPVTTCRSYVKASKSSCCLRR